MQITNHKQLSVLSTGRLTWPTDTNKIPDTLYFGITNIKNYQIQTTEFLEFTSDHTPVQFTINSRATKFFNHSTLTNSTTNWDDYRKIIEK